MRQNLHKDPLPGEITTFMNLSHDSVKAAIEKVTALTDNHMLSARTNGSNIVFVELENLRSTRPGVRFEFKMDSGTVCVGPYDTASGQLLNRQQIRNDQGIINQTTAGYISQLGL